ncbi:ribokinase [Christensenella intestinihominis]|uniref:ribokinase n=1 Tax=Christensenella intestinihominis TaxID=1851429 RepID=UPI0008367B6F|nr:ribokinase [Christensenella intestinihominis]
MKKPRILVVGSINHDIIYQDMQEEGMNGNGMVHARYEHANGGKASIQAGALARLGATPYLAGCIGQDAYGNEQIAELKRLGVRTEYINTCPGEQTGLTFMLMLKDNSYHSATVLGANLKASPELVEKALSQTNFDMVMMQFEIPIETVFYTYEMASRKNIPVILDPGPPRRVPLERFRNIFMISPNEHEAEALTGIPVKTERDALAASQKLFEETGAKRIVLKWGSTGAYYYDGHCGRLYPSFKVRAVDSTGAGDSFTAELAVCLAAGCRIEEAIRKANAAGAICVSRYGGLPSVPSAADVDQFIEKYL